MLTKIMIAAAAIATLGTGAAVAQTAQQDQRFRQAQERFDREYQLFRQESDRYAQSRSRTGYNDNRYNTYQDDPNYEPSRYYRSGNQYQERVLSSDDRVYTGADGRYYCRRSDGTTGLIVGAAGGGILGNVIDGGRSRTVGTLLGAAVGAVAGRAVERNQQEIRCR
ncbi:glycine zipper 2TM domain-containing protein [Sphingomonas sp.]|jgi:hypothetical protein|uniref:glycine zipper 2TM domain-containing protein n=1 Tax=Sphingomonas sp. TaxID=28214 RepID=UPI002D7F1DB2|nr:glycine zipper 2TM domain-containing protein [Sphingomonas sp.]HEU0045127.1 glycine zipper 2TM domain-containing protein [Sphingomonas sp.]